MKYSLHPKSGVTMSTSNIHVATLPSSFLNWDSGRELISKALGEFYFYEMNEHFYASGIVLSIFLGRTENNHTYHFL